jgi:hypothetical protein
VWSRAADGGAAGPLWLVVATLQAVQLHVLLLALLAAWLTWKVRLAHHGAAVCDLYTALCAWCDTLFHRLLALLPLRHYLHPNRGRALWPAGASA